MPETIEAEVVAIDGKPPAPEASGRRPERPAWEWTWRSGHVRGSLRRLDRRWWPLWLLLGVLLVGLVLVLGLVAAGLYVIVALIRGGVRLVTGLGGRTRGGTGSLRPR